MVICKKLIFGIILSAFLFSACSKDKSTIVDNTWVVRTIQVSNDSVISLKNDHLLLSFKNKKEYSISLDVNAGNGVCDFGPGKQVNFESAAVTEMCCDSDSALAFSEVLEFISEFYLLDDVLELSDGDSQVLFLHKY